MKNFILLFTFILGILPNLWGQIHSEKLRNQLLGAWEIVNVSGQSHYELGDILYFANATISKFSENGYWRRSRLYNLISENEIKIGNEQDDYDEELLSIVSFDGSRMKVKWTDGEDDFLIDLKRCSTFNSKEDNQGQKINSELEGVWDALDAKEHGEAVKGAFLDFYGDIVVFGCPESGKAWSYEYDKPNNKLRFVSTENGRAMDFKMERGSSRLKLIPEGKGDVMELKKRTK